MNTELTHSSDKNKRPRDGKNQQLIRATALHKNCKQPTKSNLFETVS